MYSEKKIMLPQILSSLKNCHIRTECNLHLKRLNYTEAGKVHRFSSTLLDCLKVPPYLFLMPVNTFPITHTHTTDSTFNQSKI